MDAGARFEAVMRRWACISLCLEKLRPEEQQMVRNWVAGEFTLAEMAKRLGKTRERVRWTLSDGCRKLMEMVMEGDFVGNGEGSNGSGVRR